MKPYKDDQDEYFRRFLFCVYCITEYGLENYYSNTILNKTIERYTVVINRELEIVHLGSLKVLFAMINEGIDFRYKKTLDDNPGG